MDFLDRPRMLLLGSSVGWGWEMSVLKNRAEKWHQSQWENWYHVQLWVVFMVCIHTVSNWLAYIPWLKNAENLTKIKKWLYFHNKRNAKCNWMCDLVCSVSQQINQASTNRGDPPCFQITPYDDYEVNYKKCLCNYPLKGFSVIAPKICYS